MLVRSAVSSFVHCVALGYICKGAPPPAQCEKKTECQSVKQCKMFSPAILKNKEKNQKRYLTPSSFIHSSSSLLMLPCSTTSAWHSASLPTQTAPTADYQVKLFILVWSSFIPIIARGWLFRGLRLQGVMVRRGGARLFCRGWHTGGQGFYYQDTYK